MVAFVLFAGRKVISYRLGIASAIHSADLSRTGDRQFEQVYSTSRAIVRRGSARYSVPLIVEAIRDASISDSGRRCGVSSTDVLRTAGIESVAAERIVSRVLLDGEIASLVSGEL